MVGKLRPFMLMRPLPQGTEGTQLCHILAPHARLKALTGNGLSSDAYVPNLTQTVFVADDFTVFYTDNSFTSDQNITELAVSCTAMLYLTCPSANHTRSEEEVAEILARLLACDHFALFPRYRSPRAELIIHSLRATGTTVTITDRLRIEPSSWLTEPAREAIRAERTAISALLREEKAWDDLHDLILATLPCPFSDEPQPAYEVTRAISPDGFTDHYSLWPRGYWEYLPIKVQSRRKNESPAVKKSRAKPTKAAPQTSTLPLGN